VFAAKGAAFVTTNPTNIGGMHVSEFGQKELVTVTPLENPSGQTLTGPGMQVSTSGPGAKAYAKSGDKELSLGDWGDKKPGQPMTDAEAKKFIADVFESIYAKVPKGKQKPTQTLIRELPIILKVDGKVIADIVNRRIFEISDSIIA
jgi:hypothetical protein